MAQSPPDRSAVQETCALGVWEDADVSESLGGNKSRLFFPEEETHRQMFGSSIHKSSQSWCVPESWSRSHTRTRTSETIPHLAWAVSLL